MPQYREFEIKFIPGDEATQPTVMMTTELSPDPLEDKWYTEELWLEIKASEQQGIDAARKWIDNFWANEELINL